MAKRKDFLLALALLATSSFVIAGGKDVDSSADAPGLSTSSFYLGIGGAYNSLNLSQYLNLIGTSNIYSGSTLIAFGQAQGPAAPLHNIISTLSPLVQAGYYSEILESEWCWGTKLSYQYLNATVTNQNIVAPQVGVFTNTAAAPANTTFTGHAVIGSLQAKIQHEFLLFPFIGRAFNSFYAYLGAGAALFGTKTNIYNVTGFADINGEHRDISGSPVNFFSSKWMWGYAAQLGLNYFFAPTWSLDLNYTYAITPRYRTNYTTSFQSAFAGFTDSGTLVGSANQRLINQSVGISINKLFCL